MLFCCCKKQFSFLCIVFIDESSPYETAQSSDFWAERYWDAGLAALRNTERTVGQINYILVRPTLPSTYPPGYGALKPNNRAFPEEMVQFYTNYQRYESEANAGIFAGITHYIKDNGFSCIGVMVDSSGSTQFSEIRPGLQWWYPRISGEIEDSRIPILPDCENGSLNLLRANGCVMEQEFYDESYLSQIGYLSLRLFDYGCKKKTKL